MSPYMAPFEARKVPFLLTLRVLWLELLTPPSMGSRRKASCSGEKLRGSCYSSTPLLLQGIPATQLSTMQRLKEMVQIQPVRLL